MPNIIVLPHPELCPEGAAFEAESGMSICDNLLQHDIDIDHACEKALLDKAWGLEPNSRLSCQAIVDDQDLVVEIPKYSINMAKENR
jgi:2Fe-2S ferredoxin